MKKFIETLKNIYKIEDLRNKIMFTLGLLLIYRIGSFVVLPGVDPNGLGNLAASGQTGFLGLLNMFVGGSFTRASVFALGIMPYISASIAMQLLTLAVPYFQKMQKEGESGRRKITQITRYLTIAVTAVQALGYVTFLNSIAGPAIIISSFLFTISTVVVLTGGTVFCMWLGEKITDKGIGNGISMLIFAGIIAGMPGAIGQALESARQGDLEPLILIFILLIAIGVVYFVVFIERGQRRLTVNYAQRQSRQGYSAQTSHLPLKVNMAGVIPAIFASSLLLFPTSISSWFGQGVNAPEWLQDMALLIGPGQPLHILLFSGLIIFFSFFYTALMYNPKEVADNLKRGGAYLPGIRPGDHTAKYIDDVTTKLTLIGGLYITLICLMPQFLNVYLNVPFYLGGTSLLIAVVVTMDFMSQVQSHLMSQQYDSLMKKANLKNVGRK